MKTSSMTPSSRPASPLLTISVVSHGNGSAVQRLMNSLVRYEQPQRLQLIVTDNLGRDLPELDASEWHSLRMRRNDRPRGYASNHNSAFLEAGGEYFCILNPDVLFVESILRPLTRTLEGGAADITAPLVVDSRGQIQDSFRRLPSPPEILWRRVSRAGTAKLPAEAVVYPDWIAGFFLLMRSETFSRLGGFDERYQLYFEDVDLCTRARLVGLTITLNTRFRLQHDARRASRGEWKYLVWHLQSATRFFSSDVYRRARGRWKQDPPTDSRESAP